MYITYFILGITILVSLKAFEDESLKRKLLLNPYDVIHYKKWYRVFTHAFIHADFMHLGFNMYVLYMFGVQVVPEPGYIMSFLSLEPALVKDFGLKGYWYFFLLYVGGIFFSSIVALYKHQNNPGYNSLGASGAVSAVIFGCIILNPQAQMGFFLLPSMPAYIFGPLLLVIEFFMSKRGKTNIAHDAHIAGAIFGIIFIIAINPNYIVKFFNAIL